MNALAFSSMAAMLSGGVHRPARPLPSAHLVAERARERRHGRPLPRRDAGDAAGGAAGRGRPHARAALRLRRRRRPAPPCRLRGALRLPAARGLGDDRDRRGGLHHGQPRAAPRRHPLLRPRRLLRRDPHRRREGQRHRGRRARRAAGARRRRRPARRLLPRLSQGRRWRPRRPGPAAGSTPATSCGARPRATSTSSTGARTSSGAAARTSRRSRWRASSTPHPAVAASAVAATPDPTRGDEVLACIVLRKAANLPAPEKIAASIVRHALARLVVLQGAGLCRLRRCLAADLVAEGAARRAARSSPSACPAARSATTCAC